MMPGFGKLEIDPEFLLTPICAIDQVLLAGYNPSESS